MTMARRRLHGIGWTVVAGAAAVGLALTGPGAALASPGLTRLGSTNGGYSFTDVGVTTSSPGGAVWVPSNENPVIVDTNIYAAFPLRVSSTLWNVYYGGWAGSSGNDDVFLRQTGDSSFRADYFSPQTKIIDHGVYTHANDPSVVLKSGTYTMALTTADSTDHCSILQSSNGTTWPALTDHTHEVAFTGATVDHCARPSLNWNPTAARWELYFDAAVNGGATQQHLAYSTQAAPTTFTYQTAVGPWVDADVRRLDNGAYVSAFRWTSGPQPVWDIRYATSSDGRTWTTQQPMLSQDPDTPVDDYGVTNPGLAIVGSTIVAMLYGMNDSAGYNSHNIGVAYPQLAVTLKTGSISHVHRHALGADGQIVETYGYVPDRITVNDVSGATVLDQAVSLSTGSVSSIQNRTLGVVAAASASITNPNSLSGLAASNVLDGDTSTIASTAPVPQSSAQSLTLDLGSAQTVRGLRLTPRAQPYGFPVDFSIQVSLDGSNWATVAKQTYTGYPTPGSAAIDLAFPGSYGARYVRLAATKQSADQYGQYYLQMAEVRVLG